MSLSRLLPLSVLFVAACVGDVGEGKVAADVAPVAAPAARADVAGARSVPIDVAKSRVEALGAKITAKHPIVFHTFTGELSVVDERPVGLEVVVDMDSLESDNPRLTRHLKNEDFFDVPNHPEARFASTAIASGSDVAGATHTITGELTVRGTARTLSFPATFATSDGRVSGRAEFVIDRQDFGVAYPGRPDDLVQDNVVMTIDLVSAPIPRA